MNALILAASFTLTPIDGYMGEMHMLETCTFTYSAGTVLTAETRISLDRDDYTIQYGVDTILPAGSGIQCKVCKLKTIDMNADGSMTFNCDMVE